MVLLLVLLISFAIIDMSSALLSAYLMVGMPVLRVGPVTLEDPPLVSIIVPVRNEAEVAIRCAESLLRLRYPSKEIIFVDGGSTDGTKEALRTVEGIVLLEEPPLPQGWVGKNWGCHEGVANAHGELFLFTDGDTIHRPWGLASAVHYMASEGADMVTLYPELIMKGFWERLMLPLVGFLIVLLHRGRLVNQDDSRYFIGVGPFLLIKRSVYQAVGGHAAVRDRIDEDLRLGERVKRFGNRLRALRGEDALELRMYDDLRELWEGWVKNIFPGLDYSLLKVGFAVFLPLFFFLLPLALLVAGLSRGPIPWADPVFIVGLLTYGVGCSRMAFHYPRGWGGRGYVLLLPVAALFFAAMALTSAYRHLSGKGVMWKGRVYRPLRGEGSTRDV